MKKRLTPGIGDRRVLPARQPQKDGVKPPDLYVRLQRAGFYAFEYRSARIKVRRGCYQYLVWDENGKRREWYMGKKESVPPANSSCRIRCGRRRGGTK